MKLLITLCATMLLSSVVPAFGAANTTADAEAAARAWLTLVDAGNYSQSYSTASTSFRKKFTDATWAAGVSKRREPLGALVSRKLESATPMQTVRGEPPGDYVVLHFASVFAHQANAAEQVTVIRDTDGNWHVHGYNVR